MRRVFGYDGSRSVFWASIALPLLLSWGCSGADVTGEAGEPGEFGATVGEAGAPDQAGAGGLPNAGGAGGRGGRPTTAGSPGKAGMGGLGEGGFPGEEFPLRGHWTFDDCTDRSFVLADSSGNGFDAVRSAGTRCGLGAGEDDSTEKNAVAFKAAGDQIAVANDPALVFDRDLMVSAWVRPTVVNQTQIIAQRAGAKHQTFTLGIRKSRAEFTVELADGTLVTASAPIEANRWSHVAGLFDGTFAFLFIDGRRMGQIFAAGQLRSVREPILLGSGKGGTQFLRGRLDEVEISLEPLSEFDIPRLACFSRPSTVVSITPETSGVVQPETPVTYEVAVKNGSFGVGCGPAEFFLSALPPSGFSTSFSELVSVPPGATGTIPVTVTSSLDAPPGRTAIPFDVIDFRMGQFLRGELIYELAEPTGCFVRPNRELMITDPSVVDDPVRTGSIDPANPAAGAWSFERLMRDMAPTPEQAPAMVEEMFSTWLTDQTVNGFVIPARTAMQGILNSWPRTRSGELDLSRGPLVLNAIINRTDVRRLTDGHAGEGRFSFAVAGPGGFPFPFTIIVEYRQPAATEADVLDWANRWHTLGALPFPSEEYNAALQAITDRFARRNAEPGRVNGNALAHLRTNENSLDRRWELREFRLSAETGFLVPHPVEFTPDNAFDTTPLLARYINENEDALVVERHVVPESFEEAAFLGGSSFNDLIPWTAPGVLNNEARHKFSLNTCNGCHGPEVNTSFLHINPRVPGTPAALSPFLTGTIVSDPVTGEDRPLNDLRRRRLDLEFLVCPQAASARRSAAGPGSVSIAEGIRRVH